MGISTIAVQGSNKHMMEFRFHGTGGQGVVLTSHLLGKSAFKADKWAHSFPYFTTAMRGGVVTAFMRIDENPLDWHSFVYEPDVLVVFHDGLLADEEVLGGMRKDGVVIVNSGSPEFKLPSDFVGRRWSVNAKEIAGEILGQPIISTVMAGAVARASEVILLDHLRQAIDETFTGKLLKSNLLAAEAGFNAVSQFPGSL